MEESHPNISFVQRRPSPAPEGNFRDHSETLSNCSPDVLLSESVLAVPNEDVLPIPIFSKTTATSTCTDSSGVAQLQDSEPAQATSQIPPKKQPTALCRLWASEVASIAVGFVSFIVIIVVLFIFDQQALPTWPLGMTLNTFLALFTTIAKAALMLPVSVSISQAQWNWFRQDRPLYDFHILDQASRGAWGSLILLWRVRWSHLVAIGAFLMVVSTVTSPITQLAINYPEREVPVPGGSSTSVVNKVRAPEDRMDMLISKATALATALDTSVFQNPIPASGAFCLTGNCTIPKYHSLGVCVDIANVSSYLRTTQYEDPGLIDVPSTQLLMEFMVPNTTTWRATFPGGADLIHQHPMAMVSFMLNGNTTFGFQEKPGLMQAKIASFVTIYTTPYQFDNQSQIETEDFYEAVMMDKNTPFRHHALEVIFHLCVQTYETNVRMGVENTRLTDSLTSPVEQSDGHFLDINCTSIFDSKDRSCDTKPARKNDMLHLRSPNQSNQSLDLSNNQEFSINYEAMELMAGTLKQQVEGYGITLPHPANDSEYLRIVLVTPLPAALYISVLFTRWNLSNHTRRNIAVENLYRNVATLTSSVMRVGQTQRFTRQAFNITGQAWETKAYVNVVWGWISFLATELVLAAGFLLFTILGRFNLRSDRTLEKPEPSLFDDSKDSSLPTLFALEERCRILCEQARSIEDLMKAAKEISVRLDRNRVVLSEVGPKPKQAA